MKFKRLEMEFLLSIVIGIVGVVLGVFGYIEMQHRRNRKKVWKGRL